MTYDSLRDFIKILESQGQLLRIQEPVSPFLEMTEIQYRLIRSHGPAVLFERPVHQNGTLYQYPVLVNLFGTVDRVALGLNQKKDTLRELGKWLAFLQSPDFPDKINDAYRMWPLLKNVLNMKPRIVKKAICQEIVWLKQDIDLFKLPIQTCWPNEPSPLITWPLIVTQGPGCKIDKRDKDNLGIYRMQVISCNKLIVRWLAHRGGARHFASWKKVKDEPFPIAVIIGADPGTILAAVSPIPDTLSEYAFAGLLRNKKVNLVKCKTVPLHVPASSEIIIEGLVSLEEVFPEGPFGDHTGYYNSVENFPVVTVTAITMRNNPIYLSTYTGRPPDEPSILGESLNELFIPLLQKQFPEIIDFWLPPEGCSYRIAVVSIAKDYPGHAKRIMMGVWGFLRQFMYIKWIIVIDHDLNPRDWKDVVWAISTCMDPKRDTVIIEDTPIDYLDFSSPISGLGSKIGLDATSKWPGETNRTWGKKINMDLHTKKKIDLLWKKLKL